MPYKVDEKGKKHHVLHAEPGHIGISAPSLQPNPKYPLRCASCGSRSLFVIVEKIGDIVKFVGAQCRCGKSFPANGQGVFTGKGKVEHDFFGGLNGGVQ